MNTRHKENRVTGHLPWVLTASCALVPNERRDSPEYRALGRAIAARDREAIALGFEILASHHAEFLTEQQIRRVYRLAHAVRNRTNAAVRELVMEIARESTKCLMTSQAA